MPLITKLITEINVALSLALTLPYLSGEVVYNLRNSFPHQGTPNIDVSKIIDSANKVDEFTLVFEKKMNLIFTLMLQA